MDAIIIRLIDMPPSVHGVTIKDAEGDYNIYINARLNEEARVETYRHEMQHVLLGHFYQDRPVADMEKEAEQYGKGKENEERQVDHPSVRVHGRSREGTL